MFDKKFEWNSLKNEVLKQKRNVSFEDVERVISEDGLVEVVSHYNKTKYPHQRMFIVKIRNYIYCVPFVEDDKKVFLKTIIPNRKFNKKFKNYEEKRPQIH